MMNDTPTEAPRFISPNEALATAKDFMLEGREPESEDDWALIFNFWAANLGFQDDPGAQHSMLKLLARIYDAPLSDDFIAEIIVFQALNRMTGRG